MCRKKQLVLSLGDGGGVGVDGPETSEQGARQASVSRRVPHRDRRDKLIPAVCADWWDA